ncbi:hypothetical protein [Pseudoprevotella muciniphila]|uniref:hypothetical protein n=1 Tax=Pseudoprevotella muciniphila TaxID=2133944 RepID=UPI0011BD093E|nr:hypothetical protein [Pseudoprevotella muciniphila]
MGGLSQQGRWPAVWHGVRQQLQTCTAHSGFQEIYKALTRNEQQHSRYDIRQRRHLAQQTGMPRHAEMPFMQVRRSVLHTGIALGVRKACLFVSVERHQRPGNDKNRQQQPSKPSAPYVNTVSSHAFRIRAKVVKLCELEDSRW